MKLYEALKTRPPTLKSHWHRHRHLLDLPCSRIQLKRWPLSPDELEVASVLALRGPLAPKDFLNPLHQRILNTWKRLPRDPKYFRMLIKQHHLWSRIEGTTLRSFFESADGQQWYRAAKKLKHKPHFELEIPYKATRREALRHEEKVKGLLRRQPLLRYQDLKSLGIKNAQVIMQKFSELLRYRAASLKALRENL